MRKTLALLLASLLLWLNEAPPVVAKGSDHEIAYEALRRGEILPLSRILAIAAERAPGEVLKVELEAKRMQYKIKVLGKDGVVRKLHLDARTGAQSSLREDD